MAEFALRELIDEKRLQHLQNEFCKVTGVTAVCVDKEGRAITEPYIDKSLIRPDGEDPILGEYRKKAAQALDRVQEGSLEEQVVEELPDGGHVAAVAVSVENQIILYWQVYDLKKLDAISFYQILDLLRDTSADIYRDRMSCFSAEAESRRSRYAEEEMSRNLHTIEATTEIVQLLDSDEQIELTMSRWLKILAQHIQVDSAEIFQLQADTDTMNVVCEWLAPGLISYFDKTSGIPEKSFLHTEKPLVVSTDSVGKPDSEEIEKIGMKAVMIFPILKQESGNMVLSLNHRRQGHVWSMAEIKFTSDAVKILQSILTRRIQKNSLAGSYAALEEILDNVGCAIYVTDQNTGRMLFANQILKNTFAKELMDHNFDALLQSSIHKDKTRTVSVVYHAEKETWYDLLCKEIAWVDGKKANLYSLYDITDKKLYQRRIEQQAYTDFLTGLYNRMCCERDLARQIDQAKKIGGCWTEAILLPECGKFAIQLDSDDLYKDCHVLQRIVDTFYQENCAMVIGSYQMVDFKLEEIPPGLIAHREWTPDNGRNNALRINGLGAPRAFYTPVLRQIKFPNVSYGEDYATALAISRKYPIARIYDPLYLCRRWEENSDHDLDIQQLNNYNFYKDKIRTLEIQARISGK